METKNPATEPVYVSDPYAVAAKEAAAADKQPTPTAVMNAARAAVNAAMWQRGM